MAAERSLKQHWPVLALVTVVFVIFLLALVLFQVQETECAVVTRFGEPQPDRSTAPGLHWRLPYPIEEVWHHDGRVHVFTGTKGELEEILTADRRNIIVTVFVTWRVYDDPADRQHSVIRYLKQVGSREAAEEQLTNLLRSAKRNVFGKQALGDLINSDPARLRLAAVEAELLREIAPRAKENLAVEVLSVGIAHLGLPRNATAKVFERMKAERKIKADEITAGGEAEARKIRAEADKERENILSKARKDAMEIRAAGDKEANQYWTQFQENPELAIFLQQLEAVRTVCDKGENILVLDTKTPPISLMSSETLDKLMQGKLEIKKAPRPAPPEPVKP